MNKILLLTSLIIFLGATAQKKVELKYDELTNFIEDSKFTIGFEYQNKSRKTKQKGAFFNEKTNLKNFNLSVFGGKFNNKTNEINLNYNELRESNFNLIVKYTHPKDESIKVVDTIKIPFIKSVETLTKHTTFNAYFDPEISIVYSNNHSSQGKLSDFKSIFKKYNIQVDVKGGQILKNQKIKIPLKKELNDVFPPVIKYYSKNPHFRT